MRYRSKLMESRTSELQRLGNVLQDAGIKLDSVASSLTTKSARAMVEALAIIVWHVLATGHPFQELGADYFMTRIDPEAETRRLVAKLKPRDTPSTWNAPPNHTPPKTTRLRCPWFEASCGCQVRPSPMRSGLPVHVDECCSGAILACQASLAPGSSR